MRGILNDRFTLLHGIKARICGRWSELFCLLFGLPVPFRETSAFFRAHSAAHIVDNPPSTTPLKPCVKSLYFENQRPANQPKCYFPMPKTGFGGALVCVFSNTFRPFGAPCRQTFRRPLATFHGHSARTGEYAPYLTFAHGFLTVRPCVHDKHII